MEKLLKLAGSVKVAVTAAAKSVPILALGKSRKIKEVKPFKTIPGPCSTILDGSMKYLKGLGKSSVDAKPLDFYHQLKLLHKGYGDIVRLQYTPTPISQKVVLLFDAYHSREMYLKGDQTKPCRQAIKARKAYFSSRGKIALSVAQGDDWRNLRSKVQKILLHPTYLSFFAEPIDSVAMEFVDTLSAITNPNNLVPSDFYTIIQKWSLETLVLVCLKKKLNLLDSALSVNSEANQLHLTTLRLFCAMSDLERTSSWKFFPNKVLKRFFGDMDFIINVVKKYVEESRKINAEESPRSLIDFFLEYHDKEVASSLIEDLLSGGVDTVANTVANAIYFLASHPEVQEKLHAEITSTLSADAAGEVLFRSLPSLVYLEACLSESMRCRPVVSANTRTFKDNITIGGYEIPKGVSVIACHGVMGMNKKYFRCPEQFIPERFLKESEMYDDAPAFAFMPFGAGARNCVAMRLAHMMMNIVILRIIQKYELRWAGGELTYKYQLHYQVQPPFCLQCIDRSK